MAMREFLDWVDVRKTYCECGQHHFMHGRVLVWEESQLCASMVTGTPSPFSTVGVFRLPWHHYNALELLARYTLSPLA